MRPSELSDLLWAQVDRVAPHLLPNGKKRGMSGLPVTSTVTRGQP